MTRSSVCSRRTVLCAAGAFAASSFFSPALRAAPAGRPADVRLWTSKEVGAAFQQFAAERRMPPDLQRWLSDPAIQLIEPYRVFDNVWNVGVKWVSSYAVKTSEGWVLIDTTHEPFVDHLFESLKTVGVPLDDIRLVLMTHGHFDHVGGYYRLRPVLKNASFVMSRRGWEEAAASSRASQKGKQPWTMDEHVGVVAKDGDRFELGGNVFTLLETPGHTWGTSSYTYFAMRGAERHAAVTIGGQGLNAIGGTAQIDAYIQSMKRLGDSALGIDVDLTAHPFSTGLTERIPEITALKPDAPHPLVNRVEYLARLDRLIAGAQAVKAKLLSTGG